MEADRDEVDKILGLSLNLSKRVYIGNSVSLFFYFENLPFSVRRHSQAMDDSAPLCKRAD
jgi:hypothetical protein